MTNGIYGDGSVVADATEMFWEFVIRGLKATAKLMPTLRIAEHFRCVSDGGFAGLKYSTYQRNAPHHPFTLRTSVPG